MDNKRKQTPEIRERPLASAGLDRKLINEDKKKQTPHISVSIFVILR